MNKDLELVHGRGKVWQDFGYPDADIRHAKTKIAARIIRSLNKQKLTTRETAKRTGFAAADFSRVRNTDFGRFTLDRLIRMLYAWDEKLEVGVTIAPRKKSGQTAIRI